MALGGETTSSEDLPNLNLNRAGGNGDALVLTMQVSEEGLGIRFSAVLGVPY